MGKSLKTLIRLAKFNVDEKQRALTALRAREEEVIAAIAEAETQLVEEQRIAAADATGIGFLYANYAGAWLDRREKAFQLLANVRQQIDQAADALAEAFGELKTYEVTQKERERREREEADRKEQIALDEIGLNIHRRRERLDAEEG